MQTVGDEEMHSLGRAIHSPFSEFQLMYASLEQDHLLGELGFISLVWTICILLVVSEEEFSYGICRKHKVLWILLI